MRSSPILSERRVSLSFFLTTPAKKPRTECCCQSVAFMIAAIVVPFGCRSIPRTVSCLDKALVDLTDACLEVATLDTAFDRAAVRFPAEDLISRDFLVIRFADFELVLLVAIWLSLMSTTASCAATDTTPPIQGRGERGGQPAAIRATGDLAARRRLASERLHRSAARYPWKPSRLRPRFRRLRKPPPPWRSAWPTQARMDFAKASLNGFIDDRVIHAVSHRFMGDSDALDAAEVERIRSNLMAHIAPSRSRTCWRKDRPQTREISQSSPPSALAGRPLAASLSGLSRSAS